MTGSPPEGPGPWGPHGAGASKLEAENALFRAPGDDGGFDEISNSPLPEVIGDYQIVGRLGGGSMADLYLAHKVSPFGFVRRAVIKTVKRSRSDYKELQPLLLDEARATACFDHPNLISLYDVGESEQGLYIALEYVEGSDLRRVNSKLRQRKEALPFELACYVASEVLRGLHHAHSAVGADGRPLEIVHRDVNPSNVLVSVSGHVKLADFGVVRMRERIQQKTEPGLVKGKYAYLAPEYIAGEPCSVQTDIYAAGIMLFELLSGRECFSGNTAYEVMWKIVNKGVPMYRLIREGVPEDLQRIVQRATSMVPERRYHTGQDMANALEAWLMRSGRHATPWVLSVFFNRHNLFPSRAIELPPPAKVQRALPAQASRPPTDPSSETNVVAQQIQQSSEARPVDNSLTPAPDVSFAYPGPGDFDIPILAPDSADPAEIPTDSSVPRPAGLTPPTREGYEHPSTLGPSDPTPRPSVSQTAPPEQEVVVEQPTPVPRGPQPTPRIASSVPPIGSRTPPPRMPPPSRSNPGTIVPNPPEDDQRAQPPDAITETTPVATESKPDTSDLAITPPPTEPRGISDRPDDSGPQRPLLPSERKKKKRPKVDIPETGILASGKLEDAPAATVLRRLVDGGATGTVEFRCGLIWKRVFITDGAPTGITSNMGMELIGEHLVKARKISRDSLDRALAASERNGKSLTVTLIEQGAIDRSTLEEELGRNLSARLQEVLEWRWGTFEFKAVENDPVDILPKLDLDALLANAAAGGDKETSDPTDASEAGENNAQSQLKEALRVARSISKSTGKGRVERPWRNSK